MPAKMPDTRKNRGIRTDSSHLLSRTPSSARLATEVSSTIPVVETR